MKDEAYETLTALCGKTIFVGSDSEYSLWSNIIKDLQNKHNMPKDLEFRRTHPIEWPLINSERPDVIYENTDIVVGIECFKFDSSHKTRKGSSLTRAEDKLERDLLSEYYETNNNYQVKKNDTNLSYEDYVESAISALQKHTKKIHTYRENLMELAHGRKTLLCFFIKDVTVLGNYARTEKNRVEPLSILCVKKFLEEIKKCDGLDYMISSSQVEYYNFETTILENSPKILAEQFRMTYDDEQIILLSEKSATVLSTLSTQTERLILRRWNENDAEDLFKYASDPDVGPIAGWPAHQSIDESRDVIKNVLSGKETYAICLKEDGKAIGAIELKLNGHTDMTNRDDECEMGYWLGKPFWGQGIMPEAVKEMLRHAFEDCGMQKVWIGYYEGNTKSKRVQEKCGFKYQWRSENVEVPLMHEKRTGHVSLMTKEEWQSKQSYIDGERK